MSGIPCLTRVLFLTKSKSLYKPNNFFFNKIMMIIFVVFVLSFVKFISESDRHFFSDGKTKQKKTTTTLLEH